MSLAVTAPVSQARGVVSAVVVACVAALVLVWAGLRGIETPLDGPFAASRPGGAETRVVAAWGPLAELPGVDPLERSGEGRPAVETTVDGCRVVAGVETPPGGDRQYATVRTKLLSFEPGSGFRLVGGDDGPAVAGAGPADPTVTQAVRRAVDDLETVGEVTADGRVGFVGHRLADPTVLGDGDADTLVAQSEALVTVAEAVEAGVSGETDRRAGDGGEP